MAWSPAMVRAALLSAGIDLVSAEINLEPRDGRQLLRLPNHRLAWFADDEPARQRMARERRVLRLVASRCTFAVPKVAFESADGAFDVRIAVPGLVDPWGLFEKVKATAALARRIGAQLGAMLAEQHTRVTAADAAAWLPSRASWPEPSSWIRARLPRVIADTALLARLDGLLERYDSVPVADFDRVLVHGDVGLHNIVVDSGTNDVVGVFDYDGASWTDRHHDFRYFLFDVGDEEMLEAALAAYEPTVGRSLSRDRIRLYNAASAASFLAFRDGVPPDQRSCGRTLTEDLAWVRYALDRCS